jgi:hypothetical protein
MLPLTYLQWARFRVSRLRYELQLIRYALADEVARLGAIDDPAFRGADEYLMLQIAKADQISFRVGIHVMVSDTQIPLRKTSSNTEVEETVSRYENMANGSIVRYLFMRTLTGWFVLGCLVVLAPSVMLRERNKANAAIRVLGGRFVMATP